MSSLVVAGMMTACSGTEEVAKQVRNQEVEERFLNITCPYTLAYARFEAELNSENDELAALNRVAADIVEIGDAATDLIEADTYVWPPGVGEQLDTISSNYEEFRPNWVDASNSEIFSEVFFAYDTVVPRDRQVADQEIRYLLGMSPDSHETCIGREDGLSKIDTAESGGESSSPAKEQPGEPMDKATAAQRYLDITCPNLLVTREYQEEVFRLDEILAGPTTEQMQTAKKIAGSLIDPTRTAVAAFDSPEHAWPEEITDEISVMRVSYLEQLANWVIATHGTGFYQLWYTQDIMETEPRDRADAAIRIYLGLDLEPSTACESHANGLDKQMSEKPY